MYRLVGIPPCSPRLLDIESTRAWANKMAEVWVYARTEAVLWFKLQIDDFGIVTYLVTGPARLPAMVTNGSSSPPG